ncbi:MAG: tyrosine-type recombinase/integrase [Pirellulaceae bacterium]
MPRISGKIPSYGRHKASGKAVVRLRGKDHYLGDFGTAESHERYERLVCEWRSQQVEVTAPMAPVVSASKSRELTIADVLFRYRHFAESYYVKNGKPSKELTYIRYALRPLRELYGSLKIREFGPLALKAVRQHMIDSDLSRKLINGRIDRVKRFMKWAVSEELAPASAYEAVRAVAGLRFGKTAARETEPVKPVPDAWVNAILPHVSRHVAAMIQLQRLTGMRPCEVVMMRACDIDMSAEIWLYVPFEHKNQWRGHQRQIPLGPKSQEIIRQFLTLSTTAYLFSPLAAEAERNEKRRQNRKTPMTPSQAGRKQKPKPLRRKRESYDVDSYRRAITYGIKSANRKRKADEQVPHWYPLQLRHSRATEVRKAFGLEAAQVSLGHAHANVTEVYAEKNLELAVEIARRTG